MSPQIYDFIHRLYERSRTEIVGGENFIGKHRRSEIASFAGTKVVSNSNDKFHHR